MVRKGRAVALMSLLLILSCTSQESPAERDAPLGKRLDRVLEQAATRNGVPGAQAAVVFPDGRVWTGATGVSDEESSTPVDDSSLFGIASVTKPIVASLILDLEHRGKLRLDESVRQWLPGLGPLGQPTIRELLSHTSGLGDPFLGDWLFEDPSREWLPREVIAKTPERVCSPGACWHYSNINYILLGLIAERAGTGSVQEQLEERFFDGLNLHNVFLQGDVVPEGNVARGYELAVGETEVKSVGTHYTPHRSFATATWTAGGIATTATDLARLFDGLFSGGLLDAASIDEMTNVTGDSEGAPSCHPYGLGVEIGSAAGGERVWTHSGHLPGFRSQMTYFPDSRVTVVVLTNLSGRYPLDLSESLSDVLRESDLIVRGASAPCNMDIYMTTPGGGEVRLTQDPAIDAGTIRIDPSGNKILFTSSRNGAPQVFVLDLRTRDVDPISQGNGPSHGASWSPDGRRIVYSDSQDADDELVVLDLDSQKRTNLTDNDVPDTVPVWSPNGRWIAFSRGVWGSRDIWLIDADSGAEQRLTSALADEWWPAWSPDSSEIAYVNESEGAIDVIGSEGSGYRRLTPDGRVDSWPAWSEGGIVFVRDGDIWTMNAQGGKQKRLMHTSHPDFVPAWGEGLNTAIYSSDRPTR